MKLRNVSEGGMSSFLWEFGGWQWAQWPRRAGLNNFILICPRLPRPEHLASISHGPRITCLLADDGYRFKVCGSKSCSSTVQGERWEVGPTVPIFRETGRQFGLKMQVLHYSVWKQSTAFSHLTKWSFVGLRKEGGDLLLFCLMFFPFSLEFFFPVMPRTTCRCLLWSTAVPPS